MPPKKHVPAADVPLVGQRRRVDRLSTTSCPRASSSAASALSRRQLPQYMLPAPPVSDRILTRRQPRLRHGSGSAAWNARRA